MKATPPTGGGANEDRIPPSQATGLNKRFDFFVFSLDINFVHQSWECDALADILFAGEPGDGSFDAEAKAAMRHRAGFRG